MYMQIIDNAKSVCR